MHLVRAIVKSKLSIPLLLVTVFGLGIASILYGSTSTNLYISESHGTDILASGGEQTLPSNGIPKNHTSTSTGQPAPLDVSSSRQTTQSTKNSKIPVQPNNLQPQAAVQGGSRVDNGISVSLYVNDQLKSVVKVSSGSNQCDVLSLAEQHGAISSLVMKYSETYQTQAVYVIDGIGDSDKVGWVYKVNDVSLPYGCSKAVAKDGDVVKWKYVN